MFVLYYHTLCPRSRAIRAFLAENQLEHKIKQLNFWEKNSGLELLNPAMELPVLEVEEDKLICGVFPIAEYIAEISVNTDIKSEFSSLYKAEVRRLTHWSAIKFYNEVTRFIINEKPLSYYMKLSNINNQALGAARKNLEYHLTYITFLLKNNRYLAGEVLSFADFMFASQISLVDYFSEVNWEDYTVVKEWYLIMKSRPAFRKIFSEKIPGFQPAKEYSLLDF